MKLNIQNVIEEHNIETHKDLKKHLCEMSGCRYYWSYPEEQRLRLEAIDLLKHCELIKLEGVKLYYETTAI